MGSVCAVVAVRAQTGCGGLVRSDGGPGDPLAKGHLTQRCYMLCDGTHCERSQSGAGCFFSVVPLFQADGAAPTSLSTPSRERHDCMTPQEVLAMCRENDVKSIDMRFMDFPGLWQHFTIPAGKLDEDVFEDGLGFDGSSIRGWQAINESRHAAHAAARHGVHRSVLQAQDAGDDLQHAGPDHPRRLHARSPQHCPQGGQLPQEHRRCATPAISVRRPSSSSSTTCVSTKRPQSGYFHIDSVEGSWNRGRDYRAEGMGPNLGYKLRYKEGYFPVPARRPADGHPQRDDADDDRLRLGCRGPAPRSGHRRSVGDRPEVRRAGQHGRQA